LSNPEWKMDIMPEIMDGKNVADFVDPDIAEKLEALEREEERLQGEGFYDNEEDIVSSPFSKISRQHPDTYCLRHNLFPCTV
jgi:nucleolar GTP-binding protein